jgi:hypothetical protein
MEKLLVYVILFSFFITVPVWATSIGVSKIEKGTTVTIRLI